MMWAQLSNSIYKSFWKQAKCNEPQGCYDGLRTHRKATLCFSSIESQYDPLVLNHLNSQRHEEHEEEHQLGVPLACAMVYFPLLSSALGVSTCNTISIWVSIQYSDLTISYQTSFRFNINYNPDGSSFCFFIFLWHQNNENFLLENLKLIKITRPRVLSFLEIKSNVLPSSYLARKVSVRES